MCVARVELPDDREYFEMGVKNLLRDQGLLQSGRD
jgi:hypothetical protein